MEDDGLCFNFSVLNINFVTAQDNRNVFTNSDEIAMPVGDVLVCDARGHVKHNNGAMRLDVITVSQTSQLLLAGCVPDIEPGYKSQVRICKGYYSNTILNYITVPLVMLTGNYYIELHYNIITH